MVDARAAERRVFLEEALGQGARLVEADAGLEAVATAEGGEAQGQLILKLFPDGATIINLQMR